jgi:hypothetical protein
VFGAIVVDSPITQAARPRSHQAVRHPVRVAPRRCDKPGRGNGDAARITACRVPPDGRGGPARPRLHLAQIPYPGANRQIIVELFPTDHRGVFVASDRRLIVSIGVGGRCSPRQTGLRSRTPLR